LELKNEPNEKKILCCSVDPAVRKDTELASFRTKLQTGRNYTLVQKERDLKAQGSNGMGAGLELEGLLFYALENDHDKLLDVCYPSFNIVTERKKDYELVEQPYEHRADEGQEGQLTTVT